MSDDTNDQKTAKLEELFENDRADAQTGGAPTSEGSTTAAPTAATSTVLPEAEPAWLGGWGAQKPVRTTPRVRWAGIVWGLVFAAAGWFTIWTLAAAERRAAFSDWILSLDGGGWAIAGALALGALLLIIGLTQGLKAATRSR